MKKKFRIIGVAVAVAVVALMVFSGVALAGGPTDTEWDWSGAGDFEGEVGGSNVNMTWGDLDDEGNIIGFATGGLFANVTAGDDATSTFSTAGNAISGEFTATNKGNWCGVDTFETSFSADVTNGVASIRTTGPAGQLFHNYVATGYYVPNPDYDESDPDSPEFVWRDGTGSAHLSANSHSDCEAMGAGSGSLDANATLYRIESWVGKGGDPSNLIDNWAGLIAFGSGTANINTGHITANNKSWDPITFGWGRGYGPDADVAFTGSGTFQVNAVGSDSIRTPIANYGGALASGGWVIPGDGTYGSCSYTTIAKFVTDPTDPAESFNVPNYSMEVK